MPSTRPEATGASGSSDLEAFVERSGPGGRNRRGPLVLVVDDDARLREFLRVSLEASGYSVSEAESGEQALAAIADERPALVLLDVVMPGVDGWQLLAGSRSATARSR